jgi:hypothetical protein
MNRNSSARWLRAPRCDYRSRRHRFICTSDSAVDAYLAFGLAEAKALIEQHRAAVWAIAEALMVERP